MTEIWNTIQEIYTTLHSGGLPDLGVWSYVLLATLVATEGPLSTLLGAAAAAAGVAELRWVLLATVVGNIVGDCVWYSVGYMGKAETLKRYGSYVGIKACHIDRLQQGMNNHSVKMILFSKAAYGLIIPTLVAAGVARVPMRKWFPVVFLMETIWSLVLVYVGYRATWMLVEFERGLRTVGVIALILVGVGAAYLLYRRRQRAEFAKRVAGMEEAVAVQVAEPVAGANGAGLDAFPASAVGARVIGLPDLAPHGKQWIFGSEPTASGSTLGKSTGTQAHAGVGSRAGSQPGPVGGRIAARTLGRRISRVSATPAWQPSLYSLAPMPLIDETIATRFIETVQAWDVASASPVGRLIAEPVEGSG